jgi:putative glutamine amidotransferase
MLNIAISLHYNKRVFWSDVLQTLVGERVYVDFEANFITKKPDFILFDGGHDVSPFLYNEPKHITTQNFPPRDLYEKEQLFEKYLDDNQVMFVGICRGNQFLNVMYGGKLIQNLYDTNQDQGYNHDVQIIGGHISNYIKQDVIRVNSTHHQAIKTVGENCTVTLVDPNLKVFEGFESFDGKTRAVQCHPESLDFKHAKSLLRYLFRL